MICLSYSHNVLGWYITYTTLFSVNDLNVVAMMTIFTSFADNVFETFICNLYQLSSGLLEKLAPKNLLKKVQKTLCQDISREKNEIIKGSQTFPNINNVPPGSGSTWKLMEMVWQPLEQTQTSAKVHFCRNFATGPPRKQTERADLAAFGNQP